MIAKQTGDNKTIQVLSDILSLIADNLIKNHDIEAVAFVSPTIQRQYQLMNRLESSVVLNLPRIKIHKVGARILIAQKTLKSLDDRILNASETFIVESSNRYKNILIIDDALGSGATLNEIAKQIVQKGIASNCFGLVLVASPSGYEVINEV
jgi:predicted amidophosphoribosyltransferase